MQNRTAEATRELDRLKAEYAAVQEALSGPRMRMRFVRDSIASACIKGNEEERRLTSWKPMGAENTAWLDAERARFLVDVGTMPEEERTLKSAIRQAEIDLRAAKAADAEAASNAGKSHRKPANQTQQLSFF